MVNIFHFCDCLANIIQIHRPVSLRPISEHLLKVVTYVINELGKCIDGRDDISEKMNIFHMVSYKSLVFCA